MNLLNTRILHETDFFRIWDWINKVNKYILENPLQYETFKQFYIENMSDFEDNEKLQDAININRTKTVFYHNESDMTNQMISSFNMDRTIDTGIRLAFEEHMRFNSKIFSNIIKNNYTSKGVFDFEFFIRQSLKFTDFTLRNSNVSLNHFSDIHLYNRKDFVFQPDPSLTISVKLKRYGFPHQSFYNFLDKDNKSIPRKKFLLQLSYFFQLNLPLMEALMNENGYTVVHSHTAMDDVIKYGYPLGLSFENLKNIISSLGYNF